MADMREVEVQVDGGAKDAAAAAGARAQQRGAPRGRRGAAALLAARAEARTAT
jgi:hypothetical protein